MWERVKKDDLFDCCAETYCIGITRYVLALKCNKQGNERSSMSSLLFPQVMASSKVVFK